MMSCYSFIKTKNELDAIVQDVRKTDKHAIPRVVENMEDGEAAEMQVVHGMLYEKQSYKQH